MPPQENSVASESTNPQPLELEANQAGPSSPAPSQAAQPMPPSSPAINNPQIGEKPPAEIQPPRASRLRSFPLKLLRGGSIYAWIFGASVLLVGLAVYLVAIRPTKPNGNASKVASLTDTQISQLKNSATVVGSAKQTLDVQSNAIFDNQVLLRNDLSVAGGIKSGGAGSFQSINIGGTGDFSDIHINNSLGIVGASTFQGQVNIQKNLVVSGSSSLGTVTASQLSVGNLVLNGDISVTRHITTNGGIPGISGGTALGGGGTASISGTDTAGSIAINTGGGTVAGILVNVTFTGHFGSTPHVIITPVGSSAAGLSNYVNRSTTGFSIGVNNKPPEGANFGFDYIVFD